MELLRQLAKHFRQRIKIVCKRFTGIVSFYEALFLEQALGKGQDFYFAVREFSFTPNLDI